MRSHGWVETTVWGAPFYLKAEPFIRASCMTGRGRTRRSPVTRTVEAGTPGAVSGSHLIHPAHLPTRSQEACGHLPHSARA